MSSVAVSVVIPCYNAAEFLADALQSVRDQTLRDFECLIIDDASTDGSIAVARRFAEADARFRLIALPTNGGVSVARNRGMAEAQGRWLALLDADDLFIPDRLERLSELGERLRADIVVDELLITKFPSRAPLYPAFAFAEPLVEFTQEDFFRRSRMFRPTLASGYMQPLMRRAFVDQSGARYDGSVMCGEDFLFYATLFARKPRCFATDYAGYLYRRRDGSLSRSDEHLHVHAQLGERVVSEFGPQLSSRSRSALAARGRDLEQLTKAMPALNALRRRDWFCVARSLIAQPRAVGTCLRLVHARAIRSWSAFTRAATRSFANDSSVL